MLQGLTSFIILFWTMSGIVCSSVTVAAEYLSKSFRCHRATCVAFSTTTNRIATSTYTRRRRTGFGPALFGIQGMFLSKYDHSVRCKTLRWAFNARKDAGDSVTSFSTSSTTSTTTTSLSPLAQSIHETLNHYVSTLWTNTKGTETQSSDCSKLAITLSVSGGCDSVAMLHACMEIPSIRENLQVVHFNHQQRSAASDQDCAFVQELCQSYHVDCHVEWWETSLAGNYGGSQKFSQDMARQWRRQVLLEKTRSRCQTHHETLLGGVILTAHHKDDSVESLLLKALRGVHLLNVSGMSKQQHLQTQTSTTGFQADQGIPIVLMHPWIENVHKSDLIDYLRQRDYTWREDESNTSPKYLRNRVRNELVPLLQDMMLLNNEDSNQDATLILERRLSNWSQQSQELADDIQPRVAKHLEEVLLLRRPQNYFDWEKSCRQVQDENNFWVTTLIQSQALHQWMSNLSFKEEISYDTLQRVLKQLQQYPDRLEWTLDLGKGWCLQRVGSVLKMTTHSKESSLVPLDKEGTELSWTRIPWNDTMVTGQESPCGLTIALPTVAGETFSSRQLFFYQKTLEEWEDANRQSISSVSSLKFTPPWRNSPVKLRQLLRGQGVPLHQRENMKLILKRDSNKNSDQLVAVQVVNDGHPNGKWIVQKDFSVSEKETDHMNTAEILIQLQLDRSDN